VITIPTIDWFAIAPELTLLIGATVLLMLASFVRGRDRGFGTVIGIASFAIAAGFAIAAWGDPVTTTLAGQVKIDDLTQAIRILVAIAGILTILLAFGWGRVREQGAEFIGLLLLIGAGMGIVAASTSFLTLFVGLELFSIALYVLCAFDRTSRFSLESGFKYLVLGSVGSVVLIYGAAFLYGATGSFSYAGISESLTADGVDTLVIVGVVFVMVGLAFKISAVPFHMWTPDVYEGAPTPVTAFMSTATKAAAFAALLRVVVEAVPAAQDIWEPLLVVLAVATMIVGNVLALVQSNLKRMLAYSSVAHAGYLLIAVIVGGEVGIEATIFYLAAYLPMTFGAFAVVAVMERDVKGIATLDSIRGWGFARPATGAAMIVFLLSLAGFPPTAGFFGKVVVFGAAIENGWTWLAVVGVIGTVISLGYYLRIGLAMYDRSAKSGVHLPAAPGLAAAGIAVVASVVLVFWLGVAPGMALDWAQETAISLAAGR
jgi:NADH-quinone oxidoreductase subunit N